MKVLVFAPHADDEILGVGGTIAKYIDEGHEVYVCVITKGHPTMFPQVVIDQLREETIGSHKFLGITETIFLEFPSVLLNEVPRYKLNKKIDEVINKVLPDIVFIPHFGDMHLDHYIVAQSVMVSVRPIKEHKVLEVYSYETLSETEWNVPHVSNTFIPTTFIDISKYLDKKLKAMNFYATQLKDYPHPRSLEAIKALAKVRGSTVGVKYAEAFSLIRRLIL